VRRLHDCRVGLRAAQGALALKLRPLIFWPHLIAGVAAGVVILTMSVTGVLLAYEKQIIAWADGRAVAGSLTAGPRLSPDTLLAQIRAAEPESTVTALTLRSEAGSAALVTLAPNRTVLVDPASGALLGEGARGVRAFFRFVTDIHRWLAFAGDNRSTGRAITGWSNLLFLFIVCSGFYLWFPRQWTWARVRSVVLFGGGLRGRARDFNWHNVIGVWSAIPLFIVVLGAVPISFPWANAVVYRLVGEEPPRPPATAGAASRSDGAANDRSTRRDAPMGGLDALWVRAEAHVPGWKSINVRLTGSNQGPAVFTIDQGTGGQPQLRGQLSLDRTTGAIVRWEPFSSQSLGRRIRSFLRFAHTGEVFGIAGQTVAALVSAGAVVLVYTGLALALRRLVAWRRRATTHVERRHEQVEEAHEGTLAGGRSVRGLDNAERAGSRSGSGERPYAAGPVVADPRPSDPAV
jgi:uncharacterized iron-regulated membrane protein